MPAPIQPSEAPYVSLSFDGVSPPKPMPMFGVNNQSARALAGPMTSISAAIKAHFFNIAVPPGRAVHGRRSGRRFGFSRPARVQAKCPRRSAKLNETIEGIELFAGKQPSARARERGRMLEQQPPRAARVDARRAQVADRHAERERPIEAGMRKKYVAAGVYGVEHAFVEAIQLRRRERDRLWFRPKADRRERNRRQPLEIRMLIHARGELVRETDVLAQHGAEARRAKMPKNH